mgnify:CR=1 FL=1
MAKLQRVQRLPTSVGFSAGQAVSILTQLFAFEDIQAADHAIITCRVHDGSANNATFTAEVKKLTTIDEEEETPQERIVAIGKTQQIKLGPGELLGSVRLLVNSTGATVSYMLELLFER